MSGPVVVQLTGRGMGAIAVVLVAGDGALGVVARMAKVKRVGGLTAGEGVYTELFGAQGEVLDDGYVVCVGQGRVEVHLHGGVAVVEGVMAALEALGVRRISVEEALALGVLGEGIDGEVLVAIRGVKSMTGVRLLADQRVGGLTAWARRWEAWVTEPGRREGELWEMQSAAQWVLERSAALMRLLVPARVAIVGAPNAGKSTLSNALLGREASITSDVAGTTRDWVDAEALFVADGTEVPVVLVDTAGIRETADPIERASIERTHGQAAAADAVVVVMDGTVGMLPGDRELVEAYQDRVVVAMNKMDVVGVGAAVGGLEGVPFAAISARRRDGLEALMAAVLRQLDLERVGTDEAFAFPERQREILGKVALAENLKRSLDLLRTLPG